MTSLSITEAMRDLREIGIDGKKVDMAETTHLGEHDLCHHF